MPLVYLPDVESLFLWGPEPVPRELSSIGDAGEPGSVVLLVPEGLRDTEGRKIPLLDAIAKLAVVPIAEIESLPGSVATWVLASKLDSISRTVEPTRARFRARLRDGHWPTARTACAVNERCRAKR